MINKKMLIIVLLFIIPINIKAEELNINLSCPEYAYPNDIVSCSLSYKNDKFLNTIIAKYKLPKYISIEKTESSNKWINYYSNNLGFVLGSKEIDNTQIMSMNLKIDKNIEPNKEYTIEIYNMDISDKEYNSQLINSVSTKIKVLKKEEKIPQKESGNTTSITPNNDKKTVTKEPTLKDNKILSNDTKLRSISLSYGNINFDKDTFNYNITVPNNITNIDIEAIPNDEKSKVTINKPTKLEVGDNLITITVTSEDNSISKYVINVIREDSFKETHLKEKSNKSFITIANIRKILIIIAVSIIISIILKIIIKKYK